MTSLRDQGLAQDQEDGISEWERNLYNNVTPIERATPGWKSEFDRLRERVREVEGQLTATARDRDGAIAEAARKEALVQRLEQLHRTQINAITDTLHREANRRDYCTDFDEIMSSMGLAERQFAYRVQVSREVTQTGWVTITAAATVDIADEVIETYRRNQDSGDIEWDDPEAGRPAELTVEDSGTDDREPVYLDGND